MIRRLRSFLKNAPFEARLIDLNEPVRETIGLLLPIATGLRIEIHSLVRNGFDAISEHSTTNRKIVVSTAQDGKTAVMSVSDTGGAFQSTISTVYPFFSKKRMAWAWGYRLFERSWLHMMEVRRWRKEGAVFRIRLPLFDKRQGRLAKP